MLFHLNMQVQFVHQIGHQRFISGDLISVRAVVMYSSKDTKSSYTQDDAPSKVIHEYDVEFGGSD